MRHGISRRALLAALAAGAVLVPTTIASAGEADIAALLLSLLSDRGLAAVVGAHWAKSGGHATPSDTLNRLMDRLRRAGWAGGIDRDDLQLRFKAAVEADYQAGDLVAINAWQIARTQAELCALAYYQSTGLI
jgi:hypothetical protein